MDISKFKEGISKLGFLKSYSSLIIPIVIFLIGFLFFIPTHLLSGKLKEQIASRSISPGNSVRSLSSKVPSREQWKEEAKYQQAYENDVQRISQISTQSVQRELLSYKVFPTPQDSSVTIFLEFGQRYRSSIEKLLSDLGASDCPLEVELNSATGPGQAVGTETESKIKDILCQKRAQSISVYANPSAFSGHFFWDKYEYPGIEEAVRDCWFWQLGYWIIEDTVDTVEVLNHDSTSVFTSEVKRIMSIGFSSDFSTGFFAGLDRDKQKEASPQYVLLLRDGLALPYTGRFSNDEIDVVHFTVSVVVSNKSVPAFMKELCSSKEHKFKGFFGTEPEVTFKHNQITILETRITPVSREASEHELYRYGEDAVVQLDLICEYMFDKQGYDSIKPESVKKSPEDK